MTPGRALRFAATLALIFVFSRALIRALPGDPLETILAESGTQVAAETLREELRLDQPFLTAMAFDVKEALRGNFGRSIHSGFPVETLVTRRLGNTAILTAVALVIGIVVALGIGLGSAGRPGRWLDRFCTIYGAVGASLPTPWLAPILAYLLSVKARLLPLGGSVWLPAITIALGFSALWSRLIRERVRATLAFGAARGARARGVPETLVLFKYGLIPCSGSLLAYLGTQVGALLTGAFVSELVFDWPGMGTLFVEAVLRRDYPVVEGAVFAGGAVSLLGTYLGDAAQRSLAGGRTERT